MIWFPDRTRTPRSCWTPQTVSDPNFMNTVITRDESLVYGYNPESKLFCHFPYNENPKSNRHYSLIYCLPLTDTIDRRKKMHVCIWRFKVASCKCASLKYTRFSLKVLSEGIARRDGRKIEWKLSEVNAKVVSRGQNELIVKFKMAAGDVISIRGQVMVYTYIPTGIKRE